MKKNLRIVLMVMVLVLSVVMVGCSKSNKKTVYIVQFMSHPSLLQISDTIEDELSKYDNIDVKIMNAEGDTTALPTIMASIKNKADLVIPIATPVAQSAKVAFSDTDTPIVFAAVANPVTSGLTGDGSENITGVSDYVDTTAIFDLIANFQPGAKIGFVYTSKEDNSVSAVNEAIAYCKTNNIPYAEASIDTPTDLTTAVNNLVSKGVTAFYTSTDNTIASAMAQYSELAYSHKIPIYCGADSMVADGGFATTGVSYVELGKQVAEMAVKIINGTSVSDIPYETLKNYAKYVNLQAAERCSLTITDEMLQGYSVLVEKDGTSHFNNGQ